MSGAPAEFAEHFWEHVQAPLLNLVTAYARCVAVGVASFAEANSIVMRYAIQRGALFLADDQLAALEDWVLTTLDEQTFQAEQDGWGRWFERNHVKVPEALT